MCCVGMCSVWVCWCVVGVLLVCLVVCGVRTHTQDHGMHIHIDAGVTCFAHFLLKKRSRKLTVHDVCFAKPLTFHNGFMCFASSSCFKHFGRLQALLDL